MQRLLVRHGFSTGNNRANYGTPAFGHPDAVLEPAGRRDSVLLGKRLMKEFGIFPAFTPVAVSNLRRSPQTALMAGFTVLHHYEMLNEVSTGLSPKEVAALIAAKQYHKRGFEQAEQVLTNPPRQKVIVLHGYLMTHIDYLLGTTDQFERFIPRFNEIREHSF